MKAAAGGFVLGLLVAALVCGWAHWRGPGEPAGVARTAPELRGESRSAVECEKVLVHKKRVERGLGLPPAVREDPRKRVAAAVRVPGLDRPQTVSAVFDAGTGSVDMFVRRDPLPWLSFDRRYSAAVYYGVRDEDGPAWRGVVEARIVRIKALDGGAHLQIDGDGRRFAGVGVRYSW